MLEVVYNSRDSLIWLYADKQMDMVLVYLVYFYTEVSVLLLGYFHCCKEVISNRIKHLPTILGREDKMIPQEGLCVVKSFIFAHTPLNIVKKIIKCLAFLRKIN